MQLDGLAISLKGGCGDDEDETVDGINEEDTGRKWYLTTCEDTEQVSDDDDEDEDDDDDDDDDDEDTIIEEAAKQYIRHQDNLNLEGESKPGLTASSSLLPVVTKEILNMDTKATFAVQRKATSRNPSVP